jgi:(+)-eremophilene synthase
MKTNPIQLPTFDYPFPHAINPHGAEVAEATTAWAVRQGLLARDAAGARSQEQYGWLAARAHPTATFEALLIVADFMSWLFFEDDHNDKTDAGHMLAAMVEDHRRFVSILDGAAPSRDDSPLCHAFHDLKLRMERHADRTWAHEFRRDLMAYFDAVQWECRNRARGTPPRLSTYLSMRPFTSAVFPCFDLFAIADELRLPIPTYDHAAVQELRFRANNVVSYCNDIFSFEKELEHDDTHNLVILIRAEHQCTLQEAIDRAVILHDAELTGFLSLEERVRSLGLVASAELDRYAGCLSSWIWANFDWTRASARYRRRSSDGTPGRDP